MITIYHLGLSQSDRIVWIMEELGLPYKLEWFDRGNDMLAPAEYLALHSAGMAPVIKDGDKLVTESAAIVEYISHKYGEGKLSVMPDSEHYADYLYWMHFNNNVQAVFFLKMAMGGNFDESETNMMAKTAKRREDRYYNYLDSYLADHDYLGGDKFSCADIMVMFNLAELSLFGGRTIDDLPNVLKYVGRISERPAYKKAMEIAGPAATRPD